MTTPQRSRAQARRTVGSTHVLPKPEWTSALTCGGRHEEARLGATLAVTMRRVAAAAGLSLGALRENWPTREMLLDLTVGYAIGQREDRFRTHATVEGLTDDLCRLDQPMSAGLAVSLLHETVEIVVGRAGHRAS